VKSIPCRCLVPEDIALVFLQLLLCRPLTVVKAYMYNSIMGKVETRGEGSTPGPATNFESHGVEGTITTLHTTTLLQRKSVTHAFCTKKRRGGKAGVPYNAKPNKIRLSVNTVGYEIFHRPVKVLPYMRGSSALTFWGREGYVREGLHERRADGGSTPPPPPLKQSKGE
jgi:hypothetical protein